MTHSIAASGEYDVRPDVSDDEAQLGGQTAVEVERSYYGVEDQVQEYQNQYNL